MNRISHSVLALFALFLLGGPTSAAANLPLLQSANKALLLEHWSGQGQPGIPENNLRILSRFFGLDLDIIDPLRQQLSEQSFTDSAGARFPLVLLTHRLLQQLDSNSVETLRRYANGGGALFITEVTDTSGQPARYAALRQITGGRITGIRLNGEPVKVLSFSSYHPRITDVFTGLTFTAPQEGGTSVNRAIVIDSSRGLVNVLISSRDDNNRPFPFFAACPAGAGMVFVSSADQAHRISRIATSFNVNRGGQILPSMMVLKSIFGDRAWHAPGLFANMTIDDPAMGDRDEFSFHRLLAHMQQHQYHTTIAYIPQNFVRGLNRPEVEQLFKDYPEYLSIVQHGNNHTPYEFFAYTPEDSASACKLHNHCGYPVSPLDQHEINIVEGMTKYWLLQRHLGLPENRVMVFPWGISPEPTIGLLGKYGFWATSNAQVTPLLAQPDLTAYDGDMRPGSVQFGGGFPIQGRYHPYRVDSERSGSNLPTFVFDLFVGKPAVFYTHLGELYLRGEDSFNWMADSINALAMKPRWIGLDSIALRMYLRKTNADGSDSLWMFGSRAVIDNPTDRSLVVHARRPAGALGTASPRLANGTLLPFAVVNGTVYVTFTMEPRSTTLLDFTHRLSPVDFAFGASDVLPGQPGIMVRIRNTDNTEGICSVALTEHPSGRLIDVQTAKVGRRDSALVRFPTAPGTGKVRITLNPMNIPPDPNRADNSLVATLPPRLNQTVVDEFNYLDSPINHGWSVATPSVEGSISTAFDESQASRVLQIRSLAGTSYQVQSSGNWNHSGFALDVRTDGPIIIVLRGVDSLNNAVRVHYAAENGLPTRMGDYVLIPAGRWISEGSWQTITRSINRDLAAAGWPAKLKTISSISIGGNVDVDNLTFSNDIVTDIGDGDDPALADDDYHLLPNYPNPFNPSTSIRFVLPVRSVVHLRVYNALGQQVAVIHEGSTLERGSHTATVSLPNASSGLYFYRLEAVDAHAPDRTFRETGKMLLVR